MNLWLAEITGISVSFLFIKKVMEIYGFLKTNMVIYG